jgi:oxygen-independent coproporphyrinogen-3 oxidase
MTSLPIDQFADAPPPAAFVPPRAAYIHVPFCRHRCSYCNFTLVAGRDDLIGDYLRAIELELGALETPREVDTLYFGGGTPTHLSADQFRRLAKVASQWFPLSNNSPSLFGTGEAKVRQHNAEWTVEANPADLSRELMDTLVELGVTRLSLGGQSFRPEKLQSLDRDHTAADIEQSVLRAHDVGMLVSLDLIFATPGETLAQWQVDLDAAIALRAEHVSTYGLTYEQGTEFWNRKTRGELFEADEDLQRDMYALAIDRLTAAGYEHYEVSNFAQPGCRSRHNQVYWSGDGYYAAGPGAARYVDGVRETNQRSTLGYLDAVLSGQSPVAEREELSSEARARELLVFSLRRIDGISRKDFYRRTKVAVEDLVAAPLKKFVDLQLLADDGERIRLTRDGLFVSDAIWPEFL